ncbi:hypothetical protein NQ318_003150 [Aromia moschata]|uniref:Uncharacterized protein n=1 Tax=Aromia moschata TaxID=1265417 RepID=A0AAV8YT35_9CUCU|nr:hypothetical protein NQ318_003150 [Aromia moschata]
MLGFGISIYTVLYLRLCHISTDKPEAINLKLGLSDLNVSKAQQPMSLNSNMIDKLGLPALRDEHFSEWEAGNVGFLVKLNKKDKKCSRLYNRTICRHLNGTFSMSFLGCNMIVWRCEQRNSHIPYMYLYSTSYYVRRTQFVGKDILVVLYIATFAAIRGSQSPLISLFYQQLMKKENFNGHEAARRYLQLLPKKKAA